MKSKTRSEQLLKHTDPPKTFRLFFTIWLIFDINQWIHKSNRF